MVSDANYHNHRSDMRLAYSSNAYRRFSIEETIRRIAGLGYAGLELLADEVSAEEKNPEEQSEVWREGRSSSRMAEATIPAAAPTSSPSTMDGPLLSTGAEGAAGSRVNDWTGRCQAGTHSGFSIFSSSAFSALRSKTSPVSVSRYSLS